MNNCPAIKLTNRCFKEEEGFKGLNYCVLTASNKKTNKELGTIRYNIFEKKITIDMIDVEKEFRRCGIASKMLKKLEEDNKSVSIGFDYLSGEGEKFLQKYKSKRFA